MDEVIIFATDGKVEDYWENGENNKSKLSKCVNQSKYGIYMLNNSKDKSYLEELKELWTNWKGKLQNFPGIGLYHKDQQMLEKFFVYLKIT